MSRYVCVFLKSERERERAKYKRKRESARARATSRVLSSGEQVPTERKKFMGVATGAKSVHNSRVYTILLQNETREERALAFCRLVSP